MSAMIQQEGEGAAACWDARSQPIPRVVIADIERRVRAGEDPLQHSPLVVTDLVSQWANRYDSADLGYLKDRFGHFRAHAAAPQFTTNKATKICRVQTTYGDYLDYAAAPERAEKLYRGACVNGNIEDLKGLDTPLYRESIELVKGAESPVLDEFAPLLPGLPVWNRHIPYFYSLFNYFWNLVALLGVLTPLYTDRKGHDRSSRSGQGAEKSAALLAAAKIAFSCR